MSNEIISIVSAIATVVVACATLKYVKLTSDLLRESQTLRINAASANVTIRARRAVELSSVVELVVRNHGPSLATQIRFNTPPELRSHLWNHNVDTNGWGNPDKGPLVAGIPVLGPGEEIVVPWGVERTLDQRLGEKAIPVRIEWVSLNGQRASAEMNVSLGSFSGTVLGTGSTTGESLTSHRLS